MLAQLIGVLREFGSATVEELATMLRSDLAQVRLAIREALEQGKIMADLDRPGAYTIPSRSA